MSKPLASRPAPAPSEAAPFVPLRRCNAAEGFQLRFVSTSSAVFGLKLHYARRSTVCLAPEEPCNLCAQGRKWEWKGYLAATDYQCQKRFVVEITNGVMPDVNRYLELWGTLRGRYITLTRAGGKSNGRLSIDFATEASTVPAGNLPPSIDVGDLLSRVFGLDKKPDAPPASPPATHADAVTNAIEAPTSTAIGNNGHHRLDLQDFAKAFSMPAAGGDS